MESKTTPKLFSSLSHKAVKKQWVKSCPKLESGFRFAIDGIRACEPGPFHPPLYWSAEEAADLDFTREMIAQKRRWLFDLLNDDHVDIPCKHCQMVVLKKRDEVNFDRLGHIDLAADTRCNLRCSFCGYTHTNSFSEPKYDPMKILRLFDPKDVQWDSAVDFGGGEPTLLNDFDEYIHYFYTRRIRVFLYTNGTLYRHSVSLGLVSGSIRWACISLDSGTPGTYQRIKKADHFHAVIENIARYARAGDKGLGQVAVKYIFSEDNSGQDDIAGFTYAMLAVRPQEVWLTFDFVPLAGLPPDSDNFEGYDYSKQINAYAHTYLLLNKYGIKPVHFPEKHLAPVSTHGKLLLQAVRQKIDRLSSQKRFQHTFPLNFLNSKEFEAVESQRLSKDYPHLALSPPRVRKNGQEWIELSLARKSVVLAPASPITRRLRAHADLREALIKAFLDRDVVLQGKDIDGVPVVSYDRLAQMHPDLVIVAAADHNREAIIRQVQRHAPSSCSILVFLEGQPAEHTQWEPETDR
ncbi:radical SAM protein [Desulfosoma sp.]